MLQQLGRKCISRVKMHLAFVAKVFGWKNPFTLHGPCGCRVLSRYLSKPPNSGRLLTRSGWVMDLLFGPRLETYIYRRRCRLHETVETRARDSRSLLYCAAQEGEEEQTGSATSVQYVIYTVHAAKCSLPENNQERKGLHLQSSGKRMIAWVTLRPLNKLLGKSGPFSSSNEFNPENISSALQKKK